MSEAVEQRDERWPLLPPALAVLGLATGLIVHWIVGTGYQPEISAVRLALLSFVSVSAILFGFVVIRTDLIRSAVFALGCAACDSKRPPGTMACRNNSAPQIR